MARFRWSLIPFWVLLIIAAAIAVARADDRRVVKMSIGDVTELALVNNFDIQVAKYDAWISQTDNDVARSIPPRTAIVVLSCFKAASGSVSASFRMRRAAGFVMSIFFVAIMLRR